MTRASVAALALAVAFAFSAAGCAREAEVEPESPASWAPQAHAQAQGAPRSGQGVFYRLPVDGEWRVHRTHYSAKNDQAYALDLTVVEGGSNKRPGQEGNAAFYAYGRPVLADAPGVVVTAVDGLPENPVGKANRYDMHGNFVVIDHGNGEFSLFAHFVTGSVKVRAGQRVAAGEVLGLCGNSGQSTMPHLHWQVMNAADPNGAQAVMPRYAPYLRDGVLTQELPDKGQTIRNP